MSGVRVPRFLRVGLAALIATGCCPLSLLAQTPPIAPQVNPGIVTNQNRQNQQQIQQQTDQTLEGPAVVAPKAPTVAIPPSGGQTFLLKNVVFDASTFLSKDELDAIARPYIGTKVDISQIQRIVKAVNDLFAEKGIVTASAYLPPQDLKKTGELRIAIVEGKLGALKVSGATRLRTDFVIAHVSTQPGQVVDVPLLTREVGAFNKTGVAQIQASLQPGQSFGLTDINLAVIEPPALSVNLFGDNQGVTSVGQYEGGFLIQGYSPLGIDDRLTLYGVGSQGNLDGNFAYSLPFDVSGGRISASYTKGHIYVVHGAFVPLDIKGSSDTAAINLAQPILVDPKWFFIGNAAVSRSDSSSTQSSVPVTNNQTNKETIGFSAGYSDGTYALSISPTFSGAQTAFQVTETRQLFSLFNGTLAGSARLPEDFVMTLGAAFQISSADLIAGDQLFQIGGPTTVRGYTPALFAAGTGYYANLELHHSAAFVLQGLDLFAFYDRGSVYSTSPAVVTLQSVGSGLSYDFQNRAVAEVSVGVPLDHPVMHQAPCELYFRLTTKFSSADLAMLQ